MMKNILALAVFSVGMIFAGCEKRGSEPIIDPNPPQEGSGDETEVAIDEAFLNRVQRDHFNYFWNFGDNDKGLIPDRAYGSTIGMSSIAATGFGLTAYIVGAERGFVTREQAAERTLKTLRFLKNAPMGTGVSGTAGYKGFYYHFLNMQSGERQGVNELSTIDTALLMAGVLSSQSYFDQDNDTENEIRQTADEIYKRVDWQWAMNGGTTMTMGWNPENGGEFIEHRWTGYSEAMILYILAFASPTYNISPGAWNICASTYNWANFKGYDMVNFGPLFGHQYSHMWIDFKGIKDDYMRGKGIDYFENSRRATLANRQYCIDNPNGFAGYSNNIWGLTACDGPDPQGYWARGAASGYINDDGTIAPTAAAGSFPFTPQQSYQALQAMYGYENGALITEHGLKDAFNPGKDWIDQWMLGIDQGPIVIMIENYRSGLIWNLMKENLYIRLGLERAGFTGGWLQ